MIPVDKKRAALRAYVTAISGLAALALLDNPVRAQEATGATTATGEVLQEVTVTANRRTENLQSVPVAVSVITGETAGNMGVVDTMSLA
ncbi:MAG: hypothetical protein FWD12_16825, partial [Alphaproteobacteria bacterium]|nr:hypothetical protein [Alphaproteobacteria bacterium]